ncbi:hypothetical protein ACJ5XU_001620, partial [Providencia stuartii]
LVDKKNHTTQRINHKEVIKLIQKTNHYSQYVIPNQEKNCDLGTSMMQFGACRFKPSIKNAPYHPHYM